ncbi:MAG TPA: GNAT family N-acetyltransferase [Nocardioidaceae bacterium]|nr:GNAT family N-acetyltransferase [Nocardioidaceae bacterium]
MTAVDLQPLSAEEYAVWRTLSRDGFVEQQVDARAMPRREAEEYADSLLADLLPDGPASPGMHLWSLHRGGERVGYLWLRIQQRSGGLSAYLMDVWVAPHVRRQGIARAAMLACESAAREMGAADIGLNVFGTNSAAIGLYASMGYSVTVRQMVKCLDRAGSPDASAALPMPAEARVSLRAMTQERFDGFRTLQEMTYAANIVRAGILPLPEARAKSADDMARLLPDGRDTAGHALYSAFAVGVDPDHPNLEQEVGLVWLQVSDRSDGRYAYGYRLEVRPELRRHGYGHAILFETERLLLAEKVRSVGLQVYDFNASARTLYEDAGFTVTSQQMKKRL